MELDVEAADRIVVPVEKPIIGVGSGGTVIFNTKNSTTGHLLDHGLEPALRQLAKKHLGDPEAALDAILLGDFIGVGDESCKALGSHLRYQRFESAPLKLEVRCDHL